VFGSNTEGVRQFQLKGWALATLGILATPRVIATLKGLRWFGRLADERNPSGLRLPICGPGNPGLPKLNLTEIGQHLRCKNLMDLCSMELANTFGVRMGKFNSNMLETPSP
jgi:hypothetical protein